MTERVCSSVLPLLARRGPKSATRKLGTSIMLSQRMRLRCRPISITPRPVSIGQPLTSSMRMLLHARERRDIESSSSKGRCFRISTLVVRSFVRSFVCSFVRSLNLSLLVYSLIGFLLIDSFIDWWHFVDRFHSLYAWLCVGDGCEGLGPELHAAREVEHPEVAQRQHVCGEVAGREVGPAHEAAAVQRPQGVPEGPEEEAPRAALEGAQPGVHRAARAREVEYAVPANKQTNEQTNRPTQSVSSEGRKEGRKEGRNEDGSE